MSHISSPHIAGPQKAMDLEVRLSLCVYAGDWLVGLQRWIRYRQTVVARFEKPHVHTAVSFVHSLSLCDEVIATQ